MATTNYPKSYILERIAARRASIESKRTTDTAIVAREQGGVREKQQAYLEEIQAKAQERIDAVLHTELGDDVDRNYRVLSNIGNIYLSTRGIPSLGQQGTQASARLQQYARELDALDHTEAYLKGTPVEEFSLTSLKRLGLMEAIKFNLDEALSQKKS